MLVELGLLEQRHKAVIEVMNGATIVDVARRYGVSRQTIHDWLRRYARAGGVAGLVDHSCKPGSCPHQMAAATEARIVALRREHPSWGPQRLRHELTKEGLDPVPGRTSVYRALVRHSLVDPKKRRRRREDYKRWERARSMELWQMDCMGGVKLTDGTECSIVTGIDDHSRFCICAKVVVRATATPVCDALAEAMRRHGVPTNLLTDNGKVFTGRFGPGPGPVLFDRICLENGIRHLLTAPYSPTTTGKVERFHKTLRAEFLTGKVFATVADAQAALDAWVTHYNTERPHQATGMHPPVDRFLLAKRDPVVDVDPDGEPPPQTLVVPAFQPGLGVTRWVDQTGKISIGGFKYPAGRWIAGEMVEALCHEGVVQIAHRGVLVATHAQRFRPGKEPAILQSGPGPRPRPATSGTTVTRIVDASGYVSFAGTGYRVGHAYARQQVQVSIVAGSVQLASAGRVVRVHAVRHDPAKEHGAFATPKGRPRKKVQDPDPLRIRGVREVPDTECRSGTGT